MTLLSPPIFADLTLRTELDYIFGVPTRTHMKYQFSEVLPYWVKTRILRQKHLEAPRLYRFNTDDEHRLETRELGRIEKV